jgi:hypothetical protein
LGLPACNSPHANAPYGTWPGAGGAPLLSAFASFFCFFSYFRLAKANGGGFVAANPATPFRTGSQEPASAEKKRPASKGRVVEEMVSFQQQQKHAWN